ncbi:MAG: BLUF domain-containing protein [Beijerinckiaceae bacterium]
MQLERLIYRSENAMTVSGNRLFVHFNDIVSTARSKNSQTGICGFLMFDTRHFCQILEGPKTALDGLYSKIKADSRHRNVTTLSREPINALTFADWSMATCFDNTVAATQHQARGLTALASISAPGFLEFAQVYVAQTDADNDQT